MRTLLPSTRSPMLHVLCTLLAVLSLTSAGTAFAAARPTSSEAPIFRFTTDGFWLNLHHFLYVLGRVEAKMSDIERSAVANAPEDQERGLRTLTPEQQRRWRAAVATYAEGPSLLDAVRDKALFTATRNLAGAGDSLADVALEASWATALEQAAPIYRQVWWPEHRSANRAWVAAIEPLLEQHGQRILDFATRAAGLPWPSDGFPIQLSGYCNWAGAYSTEGRVLVLSSLDQDLLGTTAGLEILFHEAMHQWDDANIEMLIAAANAGNVRFPGGLSHAMLFFTIGEAVRTVIPAHVPYADRFGIWRGRFGVFLPMIEDAWRPYLHGIVSRDRALAKLMAHLEKPALE